MAVGDDRFGQVDIRVVERSSRIPDRDNDKLRDRDKAVLYFAHLLLKSVTHDSGPLRRHDGERNARMPHAVTMVPAAD